MRTLMTVALLPSLVLANRPAAGQSTLNVGDATINCTVAGSGPAVILVHGWALNLHEWDDQIAALAPRYRVVAYDRRGYGKSTGYADPSADPGDLQTLLDTLHIHSAVLVGHSAGADVVIRFAAAMPDRVNGLVLYGGGEPAAFPVPDTSKISLMMLAPIVRHYGTDSLWKLVASMPMFRPGPHRTAVMTARLDTILAGYNALDLLDPHPESGRFPRPSTDVVRRWSFPVLFISGAWERPRWNLVADSLVRWMPHAGKVIIPGGGHGVHLDEPALFNAALLKFLADTRQQ